MLDHWSNIQLFTGWLKAFHILSIFHDRPWIATGPSFSVINFAWLRLCKYTGFSRWGRWTARKIFITQLNRIYRSSVTFCCDYVCNFKIRWISSILIKIGEKRWISKYWIDCCSLLLLYFVEKRKTILETISCAMKTYFDCL